MLLPLCVPRQCDRRRAALWARNVPIGVGVPPIVSMQGLTRQFGDVRAIDEVTLDVPTGAILGVIGPSGSGKTTLIRMLTGTLEPSAGRVRVLGEEPRRFHRRTRERIGYMPQ